MMLAGGRSWRNWGQKKKETYTLDETLKEQKKNMGFLKQNKQTKNDK